MAVDTETKRRSAQAYPFHVTAYPVPSGTIGAESRRHAAGMYSGLTAAISYTLYGDIFLYTAANWGGLSPLLQGTMRSTGGTIRVRLWDLTASSAVASSTLSQPTGSFARVRSGALTLVDGNEYQTQFSDGTGEFLGSKLYWS